MRTCCLHPGLHLRNCLHRGLLLLTCAGAAQGAESEAIMMGRVPVELHINRVTDHTIEFLFAPIDPDGRAALPPASNALIDYPRGSLWQGRAATGEVRVSTGALDVHIFRPAPLGITVRKPDGTSAQRLVWTRDGSLQFQAAAPVFGLGQGGGFDRRGSVQSLADGYFAGEDTNRNISPLLIGADGWALFFPDLPDDTEGRTLRRAGLRGEFDLRVNPGYFRRPDIASPLRVLLVCATEPAQILDELNRLTGAAVMPPRWALGYMQSHRTLAGWEEVSGVARTFREKKLPCDALIYLSDIYCPSGWGNGVFPSSWKPRNFPDPAANLAALHQQGYKVVLHIGQCPPVLHGDSVAKASFDPTSIANYWEQHRELFALGVDGWWPDDGEDLTMSSRLDRQRMYYDGPLLDRPDERPFSLNRTGPAGTRRFGGWIWSGDSWSTWKTLAAHVPAGLNHSLSITPFWGSDTGGFIPKEDLTGELYVRWFQLSAFSSIFRSHGRNWHLRLPWGWNTGEPGIVENQPVPPPAELRNAAVEPICRQYLELRYRLLAYNYTLAREACDTGLPMMRALWIHHADDPRAVACDNEYLWGRDLLVAPVSAKGATQRSVYLPRGTWFDWWTGAAHIGGREITRAVDLATLPLYVRAGSIVPLEPVRQYTGESVDGPLTLLVHAGADGTFTVYDDDGHTLGYQRGEYTRRRFDWDDAQAALRIHPTEGNHSAEPPGPRDVVLRVRWPDGRTAERTLARVERGQTMTVSFR